MTLKERIGALRAEGKSYRQIEKALGCARSAIAYHLNSTTAKRIKVITDKRRDTQRDFVVLLKQERGGKCESCGLDVSLKTLDFHHREPSLKEFSISKSRGYALEKISKEAEKCALVCKVCHVLIHEELIPCPNDHPPRSNSRQSAPRHRKGDSGA